MAWSRLKKKIASYVDLRTRLAHDGESINPEVDEFLQQNQDCKDTRGKINPILMTGKYHMSDLNAFMNDNTDKETVIDTWLDWLREYNEQASTLGLGKDVYNYTSNDNYMARKKWEVTNPTSRIKDGMDCVNLIMNAILTTSGNGTINTNRRDYGGNAWNAMHRKKTDEELVREDEDRARTNMTPIERRRAEEQEQNQNNTASNSMSKIQRANKNIERNMGMNSRLLRKVQLADGDNEVQAFLDEYAEYKNNFGKISALVYCGKKYADDIANFMVSGGSKNDLKNLVLNGIAEIQDKAKALNIPSSEFDYCSDNYINRLAATIDKQKNIKSAAKYVYDAILAGDKLTVSSKDNSASKVASKNAPSKDMDRQAFRRIGRLAKKIAG